eukprot:SAG11_NODE_237_length_11835_cov_11.023347_3_plen_250_part_00
MENSLTDLLSERYNGGLFTAEDIEQRERTYADEHVSASDGIEKYFGAASFLAASNPNQDPVHREFQLAIMEVDYGTHLMELLKTDRVRAHNIILLCRKYAREYKKLVKDRSDQTMQMRVEHLRAVLRDAKEKSAATAKRLEELEALADAYVFPSTAELVEQHKAKLTAMTKKDRKAYLSKHFDMYLHVHKLNTELTLRYIWHPTASKSIALWKQGGETVPDSELIDRYLRCGSFVRLQTLEASRTGVST